jgi:hypothetical protein
MLLNDKRGVSAGVVTSLVIGFAGLIIAIIVGFFIVQTIYDADLLDEGEVTTTTTNETGAWLNTTDYPLTNVADNRHAYTLTTIWGSYNQSSVLGNNPGGYNVTIPLANATTSISGDVTNATSSTWKNVSYSYTYLTYTDEEWTSFKARGNYTEGVDNLSGKIPTVLLIGGILLILMVMVILVGVWNKTNFGGAKI